MIYIDLVRETLIKAKETFDKIKFDKDFSRRLGIGYGLDVTMFFDKEVEKSIINNLKGKVGKILSEEAGIVEIGNSNVNAIIDPVDGSINASRNIPFYSSSIALFEGNKFSDCIAAGVINLGNGEIFIADKNGLYFNGEEVRIKKEINYKELLIGTDLKVIDVADPRTEVIIKLFKNFRYLRFLGSLALELSYVSIGRIDAFVVPFERIRLLDIIAGLFLVKSAGGYIELLNDNLNEIDIFTKKRFSFLAAANEELANYIKKTVM